MIIYLVLFGDFSVTFKPFLEYSSFRFFKVYPY